MFGNFWTNLSTSISNGLFQNALSVIVRKAMLLLTIALFLFVILPDLVTYIVPPNILGAMGSFWSSLPPFVQYLLNVLDVDYALQVLPLALGARFILRRI